MRYELLIFTILTGYISAPSLFANESNLFLPETLLPELEQLIVRAEEHSKLIELSQLRREEAEGNLIVAHSDRLPRGYFNSRILGSYEYREDIDNQTRVLLNNSLNVTQPIYHWGSLKRREAVAQKYLEVATMDQTTNEDNQLNNIRRIYLSWLKECENEKLLSNTIALANQMVSVQKELQSIGQTSEQNILELEARLLEREENLVWIQRQKENYLNQLRTLSGDPEFVDNLAGGELPEFNVLSLDELDSIENKLVSVGKLDHPQIERQQLLVDIEKDQIAIINKMNYPRVDFVTGFFTDQLDSVNANNSVFRVNYYAGLQVNWDFFDGWRSNGLKLSAMARKRIQELNLETIQADQKSNLQNLMGDLRLSVRQLQARSKRTEILERRVELLREQAGRNLVSGIDRLEGELAYEEVRQRYTESKINYLITLSLIQQFL